MELSVNQVLTIENQIVERFGLKLELAEVIAYEIAVSRSATMTVFLASDDKLYALVNVKNRAVLADIIKMLSRAGVVAEQFFPPAGKPDYFRQIGLEQYQQVYPSRQLINEQDLAFYKTLAPYNPALSQVKQVKNGRLNVFDADVKGNWRLYCQFYYNKIDIN